MKKLMIIFIAITLLTPAVKSYSQNTALDSKKGFKDFTLGDVYSKWSNSLTYTNTDKENIMYYNYTGTCCQQVFDYNLTKIRLGFKNNVLQVVFLVTTASRDKNWLSSQYKSLKSSFTYLYDTPYEFKTENNDGGLISAWKGQNVYLKLEYVYEGVKQDGVDVYTNSHCEILIGFIPTKSGF